ncbi:MAG: hypothetical protein ACK5II_06275 [Paracoccus sp. (in: a-proteobacteria)]
MTIYSIGDQARAFVMQASSAKLKKSLDILTQELSSGKVADIGQRLQGNTRSLNEIESRIKMLDQYQRNAAEAAFVTEAMQNVLDNVHRNTSELALEIIAGPIGPAELTTSARADDAADILSSVVSQLNSSFAGQHLFSGLATDLSPLIPANQILDQIEPLVSGLTSASDVVTVVSDWFDTSTPGGFLTNAYRGTVDETRQIKVAEDRTIEIGIDASSSPVRGVIEGLTMIALASRSILGGNDVQRYELMQAGADLIVGGETELLSAMAQVGFSQKAIADSQVLSSSTAATLNIARNDILAADPFQTSVALSETESHLDALYTVTARLSRLKLTEYLR